jgi:hypothetical protein
VKDKSELDNGLNIGIKLMAFLASGFGVAILAMVALLFLLFCCGIFMLASVPV